MNKQRRGAALRLLLSVILMGLLFSQIDTDNLLTEFQQVNLALYALGLLIFIGSLLVWAFRWYMLLRHTGEQVSFRVVFTTLLIGLFLSLFLPSVVGMDAGRMHELSRLRENKIGVVSTVLLDRLIGLVSLVLTALLALLLVGYQFVTLEIALVIIAVTVALLVLWGLFFNRRFMQFFRWTLRLPIIQYFEDTLRQLYNVLHELQTRKKLLLMALAISMVIVFLETLSVMVLAAAIGVTINPVYFFVFMPIIWVLVALPVSIGGLGVREAAFVFFFTRVGMLAPQAVLISLLYFSFSLIMGAAGGIIWMRSATVSLLTEEAPAQV